MSFLTSLKGMDQRFSWSFLGFLLAIVFGVLSIYLGFFKSDKPNVIYQLVENNSVLDIKEQVDDLEILFKENSLSETDSDLRLISFKVENIGAGVVLATYYDNKAPLGFEVSNGVVDEQQFRIQASNDYLSDNVKVIKIGTNKFKFPTLIIEPNEYFIVSLIVSHERGVEPKLVSSGKIAGIKEIEVVTEIDYEKEDGFVDILLAGSWIQNILKLIAFGISFILLVILIIFMLVQYFEYKSKRKRRRLVELFKGFLSDKISGMDEYMFTEFINDGSGKIKAFVEILNQDESLELFQRLKSEKKDSLIKYISGHYALCVLHDNKVIKNGVVDQHRSKLLEEFYSFLKRKGEFKTYSSESNEDKSDERIEYERIREEIYFR